MPMIILFLIIIRFITVAKLNIWQKIWFKIQGSVTFIELGEGANANVRLEMS